MSRPPKHVLRALSPSEKTHLERLSRSKTAPASEVARAKALLAVSSGYSFVQAARLSGQLCGDTVARWVQRFNAEGVSSLTPRHGGGVQRVYSEADRALIVKIARSAPDPRRDGAAVWSLKSLRKHLKRNGLATPSTYTLWRILHDAGIAWQKPEELPEEPGELARR